jgi:DNA-binding NtrC family response regulator
MNQAQTASVLIIDDEEGVRESIGAYLEDFDFQVALAACAQEGWDQIEIARPQVAVVDMRLPDATGETWILRAHELDPDLVFIIFTGSIHYELPDSLRALGMKDEQVLHKPILDLSQLIRLINRLMGL